MSNTPRITPIPEVARKFSERRNPDFPARGANIYATLARNRPFNTKLRSLLSYFFESPSIPPRQRELVVLRMSWLAQCEYVFGQHTLIARSIGIGEGEIEAICDREASRSWTAADVLLLRMTDELYRTDRISDATWASAETHWDHEQLLGLVGVAGTYRLVCSLALASGVELDDGVPPWPACCTSFT